MPSFPTSIAALSNPTASSATSNPSHAGQHSDINDEVEAVETKLGTGASVPTTTGHVLTVTGAGATAYASPAPLTGDYLVGTAQSALSAEIVVGASPGGELGGTWASPTVDSSHAGGTHAATQAAAESTAAGALTTHAADTTSVHGFADTDKVPRGVLGYAQLVTGSQGSITTEADLTSLSVAVTVGTSRRIRITAGCLFSSTVGSDSFGLNIKEGSTQLNGIILLMSPTGGNYGTFVAVATVTPSAGAHTYKLSVARVHGTGTGTASYSAANPGFILVDDIGAA